MTHDHAEIRRYMHSQGCHGIVYRDGEMEPCEKPAVAIVDGRGGEAEGYWPACAYHANRYSRGKCVPLHTMIDAIRGISP